MIGRTFLGRYEVTHLLGEGGMGRVYVARQLDLNRTVVIKVMTEDVAADPKFRDRFERETMLMARFQHPYVVTLYDASLVDPLGPCIVMEYVRGKTLEQLLDKNKRFTAARVGRILGQLCEALQAAHDQGIVHRDLKPANIMIVDADTPRERIKVMDFGLAKVVDKKKSEFKKVTDTNVDFAVGTPGYISPEQVKGDDIDPRSDLYSVGVMAYELLTGQLPFRGQTTMDMVLAHATERPPSFAEIGMEDIVPPGVEEVVLSTLAKDPDDRPQSASALAELFDLALTRAAEESVPSLDDHFEIHVDGLDPEPRPFEDMAESPPDDPLALQFSLEAWMPQRIAIIKLRGFVEDNNGNVLESTPGLIRVRFAPPTSIGRSTGPLSWLGLKKRPPAVFLDLRMTSHPARDNLLQIQARFRTGDGSPPTDATWRKSCVQRFIDLRGYLIGATEAI